MRAEVDDEGKKQRNYECLLIMEIIFKIIFNSVTYAGELIKKLQL